jgi:hypothetical protein
MDATARKTSAPLRTAKSHGPNISTLVSSWRRCSRIAPATGARKPDPRGECEGTR